MSKLSPMMQQYLKIKADHRDHVVFFRLGDFYEMFFEDAVNISRELELTLTGRDCGMPERAPMCGIPYHASAGYIKKLVDKGYKVAICEQTENPSQAKGIVNREVVRLITPGTLIEGDMLEDSRNNYIASFYVEGSRFTACFADISTGEAFLTEQDSSSISMDLVNEISKFIPSEILYNDAFMEQPEIREYVSKKLCSVASTYEEEGLNLHSAEKIICKHFDLEEVSALGIHQAQTSVPALGGLLMYLNNTQHDGAKRIVSVTFYKENQFMNIDITARRNLEITETMRSKEKRGTLLWVLDKTKTSMGKRYMRKALEQPLLGIGEITRRQNAVRELTEHAISLSELQESLSGVYDLERLMTRVIYGSASPRELNALAATACRLPSIKEQTASFQTELMKDIHNSIHIMDDIANLVHNAIVEEPPVLLKDGGYIKPGFHKDLDELRGLCTNAKSFIDQIEKNEREATGIKNLKIKYNRVFGYYIEITNSYRDAVPKTYIRKQTLTNCERYITEELKELETRVLTASEKIIALESEILTEVKKYIASRLDVIQQTANAVARLDFLCSLAFVAVQNEYVCPQITLDGKFDVSNGRHPVVEEMLSDAPFVPNDTCMDGKDNRMLIITGPNMAGKSTYMRQVALLCIMAQIGSFVPAQSACIGIVDRIFTRVGASDDLTAGQSTFMVEMSEVAHILKFATPKSLVILDEIGRGTSTFDGMSIAKAVVEYMVKNKNLKCKTLFATHYHELTSLEQELEGVKNYNIAVKKRGDDITFLRKIIPGGADDSFGIEVAKLAGVPDKVVARAKEILRELEQQPQVSSAKSELRQPNDGQMNLISRTDGLAEKIRLLPIDTITPIEALNMLYELKKMVH